MTIIDKMKVYNKLRDEIDSFIRHGLYQYLNEYNLTFSSPDGWNIDEDFEYIVFFGEDGSMGCYNNVRFHVPMEYFGLDPKDFKE